MQAAALRMTRAQVGQLEGERDGAVAQFDDEREGRLLLQSRLTGLMVQTAELQKINAAMSSEITRLQDGVHAARVGGQAAAQPPPPPLQLPSQFRPQPLPTDWPAPSADAGGRDEMLAREISRADQQLSLMQQHMPPNSGPIPPPMPPAGGLSYTSSVPVARPQPTSSGYGGPLQQTSSG